MEGSSAKSSRKAGGSPGTKEAGTIDTAAFLSAFGLTASESDVQELASYVRMFRGGPSEVLRHLPEISQFFQRIVPDSALARERLARSLEGVEYLVRATRTVIASDDPDLIRGFQRILKETAADFFPEGVDRSKLDVGEIVRALLVRTGALVEKIPESQDPRVQEAIVLLFRAGQALNPVKELPRAPAADTIELKLQGSEVTKSKRRGKASK